MNGIAYSGDKHIHLVHGVYGYLEQVLVVRRGPIRTIEGIRLEILQQTVLRTSSLNAKLRSVLKLQSYIYVCV